MKHRYIILSLTIALLLFNGHICLAQLDYGDAPDPFYPTLFSNNGARHAMGVLFLGNQIDGELDGQPLFSASGDDTNGVDDEDGINFSGWLLPGQNATIVVQASAPGFLDAWIDFQANGNWTDTGDQIITNQILAAGQNNLVFSVPITAIPGTYTYGRFRLSLTGGLLPTGMAPDGEVEDYHIFIGAPTAGNIVMDPDPGLSYTQNEISMTIESTTGNIISAYNDSPWPGGPGLGISYSADNGQSWNPQQLPIPTSPISGLNMLDAFDPTVTSDGAGNAFVAYISTDYNWATGPESGLYVHKSTDGGINWTAALNVDYELGAVSTPDPNYRLNDRCQIKADQNPSSPYYNNIYISWIKDRGWNMPTPDGDIYVSYSSDGGNTFSAATQINSLTNSMGNMPIPAIAINGDLYVLWVDYNVITGGNGALWLDKSTDGGVTWGADVFIGSIPLPPLNLNNGTDARAKGAAILRTDPLNANQLYIVYAADPDGIGLDEADIFFIKSTNGGANWSTPLRLNDDITTNDQVLPWMEVKSNGIIDVVWYDRRNDPSDLLWDVYLTTSIDGGTTFATNTQVNATSFLTPQTQVGPWFGEYLGLAVSNSTAYIGFTSSSIDTKGDVFFTSFTNPSITGSPESIEKSLFKPKIFPNPTQDIIYIDNENADEMQIELFDYVGKLILYKTTKAKRTSIDLSGYSKGIYFIKLRNRAEIITRKVMRN